jgi:hypothetical protein
VVKGAGGIWWVAKREKTVTLGWEMRAKMAISKWEKRDNAW